MKQRILGSLGLEVSVLGLGTMTFGNEANEATSHAILDRYLDAGGTFIDTADVYNRGVSEEFIGRWLADRGVRDDVVVATKARFAMSDDPADRGAGRGYLQRALDASLRRLGVDHVDPHQRPASQRQQPRGQSSVSSVQRVEAGDASISIPDPEAVQQCPIVCRYGWVGLAVREVSLQSRVHRWRWDLRQSRRSVAVTL